ncbi:MAG: NAD-dependent epimerase/dehydratase family protein, partial [Armatimonadota bacterium]
MKVVIPGGSGHVGAALIRHFRSLGWDISVLSRKEFVTDGVKSVLWDGKSVGEWCRELEDADVVINLAGRSVNCRYDVGNLNDMMNSRVDSVRVIGEAIAICANPPKVWLQASTATIYAHRFDSPNDEFTGIMCGDEPGAPFTWNASIKIAKAWED